MAKYVSASVCHAEVAVLNPPKASTMESSRNFESRGSFADRLWMGGASARKPPVRLHVTARQTVRDFADGSLAQWNDEVSGQVPSPPYLGTCQLERNAPGDRAAQTRQRKFSRRKAGVTAVTARNMMSWPGIPDARSCSLSPNAYPSSIMSSSPNDATPRPLPSCKFCGDCAALSCNKETALYSYLLPIHGLIPGISCDSKVETILCSKHRLPGHEECQAKRQERQVLLTCNAAASPARINFRSCV